MTPTRLAKLRHQYSSVGFAPEQARLDMLEVLDSLDAAIETLNPAVKEWLFPEVEPDIDWEKIDAQRSDVVFDRPDE